LGGEGREEPSAARVASTWSRHAPDFVIVGAQRGGTTSLYRALIAHPEIAGAVRKEVHFFDLRYDRGMDWYLAHFPKRGEAEAVGEASPFYLFHPLVPRRMREALPTVTPIALLRNPVDRAYSQYQLNVRRGQERRSFEDALDAEPTEIADQRDVIRARWSTYLARGRYAEQLDRWFDAFPREQLLIASSEEFFSAPEPFFRRILARLGLPGWSPPRFRVRHRADYAPMNPATRRRLEAYFAPHNRRLYALLGRDLGWGG
jgi:hypothetical protein